MRYFAVFQSEPNEPSYGMALGVQRFEPERPELYDRQAHEWVFYPEMVLGFTGLGGSSDHIEVSEEFANRCIDAWQRGTPAPNVLDTLTLA